MPDFGEGYSNDGFHRQRRNLLVGCVVLVLIYLADVRIGAEGTALGVPFKIGKPEAIHWALFVAVLYWALRFYQYHRVRKPVELMSAAREVMWRYLLPRAMNNIVPARPPFFPPDLPEGSTYDLRPHDFGITSYELQAIHAHVNPAWFVKKPGDDNFQIMNVRDFKVLFKGPLIWRARILGYVKASVNTPAFTDYIFPYLAFVATMCFVLYRVATK